MPSIRSAESMKTYGLPSESIPVYFLFGFFANSCSDLNGERVLVKFAPLQRLNNEIEALELCRGYESVRQLIDVVDSRQSIVLEYLHKNLYNESCERKLKRCDIKRAIKTVLEGLVVLHAGKRVHTGLFGIMVLIGC
jgi:hypothetical protein